MCALASTNSRSHVASGCRTDDVVNCNSLLFPQVLAGTTPACTLVQDSAFEDLIQLHVRPGAGGSPAVWLQHVCVHRYSNTFAGNLLATIGSVIATSWPQQAATTAKRDLCTALDKLGRKHLPSAKNTKVRSPSEALAVRVSAGCMVSQLVATACMAWLHAYAKSRPEAIPLLYANTGAHGRMAVRGHAFVLAAGATGAPATRIVLQIS
jgi:hypothetical protein